MEVVYVQVEIFRDGRIKHKASMASDSGCRASLDLDRRQYSDRALAQMAALMGEDQTCRHLRMLEESEGGRMQVGPHYPQADWMLG
jgi:hypothetical protein